MSHAATQSIATAQNHPKYYIALPENRAGKWRSENDWSCVQVAHRRRNSWCSEYFMYLHRTDVCMQRWTVLSVNIVHCVCPLTIFVVLFTYSRQTMWNTGEEWKEIDRECASMKDGDHLLYSTLFLARMHSWNGECLCVCVCDTQFSFNTSNLGCLSIGFMILAYFPQVHRYICFLLTE